MRRTSIGRRLYLSIMTIFLVFAVAFIAFQQQREKEYKTGMLNLRLQLLNKQLAEDIAKERLKATDIDDYAKILSLKGIRITIIHPDGTVTFDNIQKNHQKMANHRNRPEIIKALKQGSGSTIDRKSKTLQHDYFYSATYFPHQKIIIRSALPYNDDLALSLQADQHFVWFAIVAIALLTLIIYRFTQRLDKNINNLQIFAKRADSGEPLVTDDLVDFSADELGEIAERIIKIYKRLQNTRKEQDLLKQQLTQNISHELKTPVASIQGYLETILNNQQINETNKTLFLRRCYSQAERLTALLSDISTLNRMDDASGLMGEEWVNINNIIDEIQKETALQIAEKKMQFDVFLPDSIDIYGVRNLLYSIFRNLTDNAIAYAGEATTITLWAEHSKDHWHFVFSDNGAGVPPQHLPRLFERFYRIDKGRSRKLGGTGLGLAIVKNSVLQHGGTINVRNNDGGGLHFDFTLK